MIFVTRDTHGELERLTGKSTKALKKFDTLIVLGDFGFVWNDSEQKKNLKKIGKLPFKVLFIDGYNEDFEMLSQYPDVIYKSAAAKEIIKNQVYYIKRGEILLADDYKILCFGGRDDPTDDIFSDNVPSKADFENCLLNLEKAGNTVDYILTHSPSGNTDRFLNLDSFATGNTFDFLDSIQNTIAYKKWYFGYYHKDKFISQKQQAVYEEIYTLGK